METAKVKEVDHFPPPGWCKDEVGMIQVAQMTFQSFERNFESIIGLKNLRKCTTIDEWAALALKAIRDTSAEARRMARVIADAAPKRTHSEHRAESRATHTASRPVQILRPPSNPSYRPSSSIPPRSNLPYGVTLIREPVLGTALIRAIALIRAVVV